MSLTSPIPESARRVVDAIRKEVQRPEVLPMPSEGDGTALRFVGRYCPMGLLPSCSSRAPMNALAFVPRRFATTEIEDFAFWWDDQNDAEAAVDAVWGRP